MSETKQKIAGWAKQICADRFDGNQTSMAEALDYKQSTLNRLLRGQTKSEPPYRQLAQDIESELGYAHDEWRDFQLGAHLVVENGVPPNTAIVIRNAHTDEVWITIQLDFSATVHKPMEFIGGEGPDNPGGHVEAG